MAIGRQNSRNSLEFLKKKYPEKFIPEDAIFSHIHRGGTIFIGSACAEPQYLVQGLIRYIESKPHAFFDAEIIHVRTLGVAPYTEKKFKQNFRHNSFFIGNATRDAVNTGQADYTPVLLSKLPSLFHKGLVRIDVALIQTSMPDRLGHLSLGVQLPGTEVQLEPRQDYLVALAHHEQDQAETMLLNLGRGSGLSGLTGMAILRGRLLRPFLHRGKAEIEAAARVAGIPWTFDQTNLEPDYRRNRLRNELLPLWQEIVGSDLTPQLARLAQNLGEEAIALETAAAELYQRALLPDGTLSTKVLRRAPRAIATRTLNLGLNIAMKRHLNNSTTLLDISLSRTLHNQLWQICRADTAELNALDLQKGIRAEVYANTLRFSFNDRGDKTAG